MKYSPYPELRFITHASTLHGWGIAIVRFALALLTLIALCVSHTADAAPRRALKSPPISCEYVRRGIGAPCFLIRAYSYIYEAYTPDQKRQAQRCLTPIERAVIQACFREL